MAIKTLTSEITGTVWKILFEEGAVIEAEAELMILESMKMEIPVEVEHGGRIQKILVAEGDPVEEDQELALIEVD